MGFVSRDDWVVSWFGDSLQFSIALYPLYKGRDWHKRHPSVVPFYCRATKIGTNVTTPTASHRIFSVPNKSDGQKEGPVGVHVLNNFLIPFFFFTFLLKSNIRHKDFRSSSVLRPP